ncbi:MAG: hypothetical protein GT598_10615 [Bacteroidales bacterium]|jgi:xanthine dehydrogenase accessory factor|nr:hypothetical protein [Bacteroidales bacterium]HPM18991.1 XdhC/CoxI family protein [Bacteroidales bacterium]HQG76302.1 XdhC/CoxI family protein [Bacteroidales bacterium]
MNSIYIKIPENAGDISEYVLAQVIRTSGSTPRKSGSSALFNRYGLVAGTIGGGVLEGKIQAVAMDPSITNKTGINEFILSNTAGGEDALCGGKASILIDSELQEHSDVFGALKDSYRARIPGVLITRILKNKKQETEISRYWLTEKTGSEVIGHFADSVRNTAMEMLSLLKPDDFREVSLQASEENLSDTVYLESVIPPYRLLIAGAGHIGKALARIGQMIGFEVTVADDRPEYANSDNIPWADHIVTGNIGRVVADTAKGKDLYIVIVTRGHRDDAEALEACIGSDAAYIGMIGSRNKVELMRRDFIERKLATDEQWKRIYAPVGLDINSETVEEIAVSIAAQIIQIRNSSQTLKP